MAETLSAIQVANEFLPLGWRERSVPLIDQMKLQKLLFYAHAWFLAKRDRPLFEEDFEAWPWGPVVKDVWAQTRSFNRNEVTKPLVMPSRQADGKYQLSSPGIPESMPDERAFVLSVWISHKSLTGIQLSNATHLEGEPWTIIRDLYGNLDSKPLIPNELISEVFKRKMAVAG